jgi:hypothetical protein
MNERFNIAAREIPLRATLLKSCLETSCDAPEAQAEGSQTCNVWNSCRDKVSRIEDARSSHRYFLARLQRAHISIHPVPEVSPLATFSAPLARLKEFPTSF